LIRIVGIFSSVVALLLATNSGPLPTQAATSPSIALGFYTPSGNLSTALNQIGGRAAILDSFFDWPSSFPTGFVNNARSIGAIPMITWLPFGTSLSAIASGNRDHYLKTWADAAKAAGGTIFIRFAHELNGWWYPWGYGVNGNTAAEYVAAWRHTVHVFRLQGATNVKWVWCIATGGNQPAIKSLYPGDHYVNWLAMDGYNRDTNGKWRRFGDIFTPDYKLLSALSSHSIMIAEMACVEDPKDGLHKAGWIRHTFLTKIPTFPRIRAVLYFDTTKNGHDYPWDSSAPALSEIRAVFASTLYTK
jgi:beta-mannanase